MAMTFGFIYNSAYFTSLPAAFKFPAHSTAFADDRRGDLAMGQQQFRKWQNLPFLSPMTKQCTTCLGGPYWWGTQGTQMVQIFLPSSVTVKVGSSSSRTHAPPCIQTHFTTILGF